MQHRNPLGWHPCIAREPLWTNGDGFSRWHGGKALEKIMSGNGAPKRLQNAYLVARNVGALATFYGQVLGLPTKFRDGERWIQYDAGGSGFALSCLEEARPAEAGAVLVFEVDDLDGMEQAIVQAGGQVEARRDMGAHGAVMSFRDPEGNVVQMFKRAPRT